MNKSGHVYLTGFTGSGKTSIGTELARRLKLDFVDLDTEVAKKSGKDLPTLFAEDGESTFRTIEREILEETAGEVDGGASKVVALGGGTLINPAVHEIVSNSGVLIWLRARWHTLFNRLATVSDRPLLQPAETRHEFITFNRPFYEARVPGYSTCDLVIDVDDETPAGDAATSIIRMMDCAWFLTVRLGERTHNVLCDSGLLARTGQMLYHLGLLPRGLVWLITTSALDADELPLARIVREDLESTRQQVRVLRIPDGEQAKTAEEVTRIHEALVGAGTGREDLIIALGGGAVNDVAGFAAATYMRGIDIVQIPTTLVGMVDAALGGKTAINHPRAKNLIGAFHQPRAILIDPVVLNTTADEYYLAGLAELVKYGCIADRTIVEEAEQNWTDILNRPTWEEKWTRANWEELKGNPWSLIPLMRKGLSIKARLVSADEREQTGQRVLLNFGHTFAHGFEHASGYAIPHGQAVALGIRAGFRLGKKRGTVSDEDVDRMDRLLNVLAPVGLIRNIDNSAVMAAVRHDKKHGRSSLRFLIPLGIGAVEIFDDVTEEEILQAIESLRKYVGRDTV